VAIKGKVTHLLTPDNDKLSTAPLETATDFIYQGTYDILYL